MQEVSNLTSNYNALKKKPLFLLTLINKYVKVDIIQNNTIYGYIHSIDPIEYSIIILEYQNETFQTTVIPGHAIKHVSEINEELINVPPQPKRKTEIPLSDSEVSERKQKLIAWLKQNLLPITESENNIEIGNVIIIPPYTKNDVCTENVIVAMQVKDIINKMPEPINL